MTEKTSQRTDTERLPWVTERAPVNMTWLTAAMQLSWGAGVGATEARRRIP
jgi:hypothetical protein